MTQAKSGDAVVLTYTVRTEDGRVVGSTEKDGPQTVTLGEGTIFPRLDESLTGMAAGEEKEVTLSAEDAFGPRRQELVIEIPKEKLPEGQPPQAGMQLSAEGQDGQQVVLTITEVTDAGVTADGNHPLAGEPLTFSLKVHEVHAAA